MPDYGTPAESRHVVELLSSEVLSQEYAVDTGKNVTAVHSSPRVESSPPPRPVRRPKFIHLPSSDGPIGSPARKSKTFVEKTGKNGKSSASSRKPALRAQSVPKPPGPKLPKLAKVSWNRKDSVKEIHCTVYGDLNPLNESLDEAQVQMSQRPAPEFAGVNGYITLRRDTKTVWNHALQAYIEGEFHTEREKKVIVVLDAVASPIFQGNHIESFQQIEESLGKDIIYIAEGFDRLFQAQINAYNRCLQRRTRAAINNREGVEDEPLPPYPSQDTHIRAKIDLQRVGRRIIYTKDRKSTVRWIMDLLKDISIKRYLSDEVMKISAKAVKSKSNIKEIISEALVQVPGVSRRQAETLSSSFGNLSDLFKNHSTGNEIQRLIESSDPEECL